MGLSNLETISSDDTRKASSGKSEQTDAKKPRHTRKRKAEIEENSSKSAPAKSKKKAESSTPDTESVAVSHPPPSQQAVSEEVAPAEGETLEQDKLKKTRATRKKKQINSKENDTKTTTESKTVSNSAEHTSSNSSGTQAKTISEAGRRQTGNTKNSFILRLHGHISM